MQTQQVVTELTVDARGAEIGSAAYVRAMQAAQAAVDRVTDAERRATEARERGVAMLGFSGTSTGKLATQWDRLRSSIDPVAKAQVLAQREIERAMLTSDAAVKRGITTQEQALAVVAKVRQQQEGYVEAAKKTATANDNIQRSAGLARHEMINFSRQMQDVGTMAAMGMSPMAILSSQGAQIFDIFASSQGTVRGFFGQVASGAASVLTPLRLVTGGVAAIGAAFVAASIDFSSATREMERSLLGIGRASGVTGAQINALAMRNATGGRQTVGESRDIAAALAGTGRVRGKMLDDVLGVSKDVSLLFNLDTAQTGAMLAKAFSDPARAVEELNQRLGSFDAAMIRSMKSMQDSGRLMEAQTMLLAGLRDGVSGVERTVSGWSVVWDVATAAVSRYWAAAGQVAGKFVDRRTGSGTLEEQLAAARSEMEKLEKQGRLGPLTEYFRGFFGGAATVEAMRLRVEQLTGALARQGQTAERIQQNIASHRFQEVARALGPDNSHLQKLQDELAVLKQRTQSNVFSQEIDGRVVTRSKNSFHFAREDELIRLKQTQVDLAETQYQKEQRLHEQQMKNIRTQAAADPYAARGQLEFDRVKREALASGQYSPSRATELAEQARARILEEQRVAQTQFQREQLFYGRQQIEMAQSELKSLGLSIGETTKLRTEHQLLAQAQAEAFRTGTTVSQEYRLQLSAIAAELGRIAELTARSRLQADLAFERSQLGRSTVDQAVYSRMQSAGLLQNGEIVGSQNEAIAQQIRLNEQLRLSKDLTTDFATGFASDLRRNVSVVDALTNGLNRLIDRLIDMAVRDVVSAAFGGKGGLGGGGGILGALMRSFGLGGGGGILSGSTGTGGLFANGAAFYGGSVIPFARGGIVSAPTVFPMANGMGLMGEAGPEAVMPLRRGRDGRLGVAAGGSSDNRATPAPTVNVQVVNNTGTRATARTEIDQSGMIRVVLDAVAGDIADGGRIHKAIRARG